MHKGYALAVCAAVWCAATLCAAQGPEAASPPDGDQEPTLSEDLELTYAPTHGDQLGLRYVPAEDGDGTGGVSFDLIDLDGLRAALQTPLAGEPLRLGLQDCVQMALRQNQDILVTAYEPLKADADILAAKGEFDPALQGEATYSRSSVSASQEVVAFGGISAVENYNTTVVGGVGGRLHTGTQYALNFSSKREETTFGNFIEEFEGMLSLTLTQPLLRGFGKPVNTVHIRAAKNTRVISEHQLRLSVLNAVADAVKAYWDLVGAAETLKVRKESLDNAERLLKISETRRRIGTAADIDVLQAKAGVATRQSDLIAARSQIEDAADRLKGLLDLRQDGRFSRAILIPTDRPHFADLAEEDLGDIEERLEASIARALEQRPEVHMTGLRIENTELEEMRARNEMLPQVDLTGTYGQGGRNHKLRQMLYGMRDKDDFTYSYGVQATIPIRNRAARGAHQRARLGRREAEQRREQTMQGLVLNVRLALRQVTTNRILVESNRQARRLQEANLAADEKRLRLGLTTSFQVLQVQEDLTASQVQEAQAQVSCEKARVDLELAEGSLLDNFGVVFETPGTEGAVGYFESIRPRWE